MTAKPKPTKAERAPKHKPVRVKKPDPDYWFSQCVRERADWKCQSCGKKYAPWVGINGWLANPGLHCSHYIGRANYSTRFDPENADAHCYFCHKNFEGNPHKFQEWKREQMGAYRYDALIERSNDIMRGKQARQAKQEIAAYYKEQYEAMVKMRSDGMIGKIQFYGWL